MSTRKQRVDAPRISPTAIETVRALTEYTEHITTYGFSYYDRNWYKIGLSVVSGGFLNTYAKKVCKELGLPWVRASGGWHEEYTWDSYVGENGEKSWRNTLVGKKWTARLTVPKKNYLAPVVAPLLMVQSNDPNTPVYARHTTTNWEFYFHGGEGKRIWDHHINFMQTDSDARKALKILRK